MVCVAEVRLQEGESVENALRRFKRKVQTENIIGGVKRHSLYLTPGEQRRLKQALARKRARNFAKTSQSDGEISCYLRRALLRADQLFAHFGISI